MNWHVAFFTALFGGLLPLLFSWIDGTLIANLKADPALKLTFFRHWGVCIADALLLPIMNGLVWDHLVWEPWYRTASVFVVAVVVTWMCHRAWWPNTKHAVYGLHFPTHYRSLGNPSLWWRDLSAAGWSHIYFMAMQLTILGVFVFSPTPAPVVWWTAALLTAFPIVAVFEPSWVISRRIDFQAIETAIAIWLATASMTAIKLTS